MKLQSINYSIWVWAILCALLIFPAGCMDDGTGEDFDDMNEETDSESANLEPVDPIEEPDFIVSGNIVVDPSSGMSTVHLSPIVDMNNQIRSDLELRNLEVFEDGVKKSFRLQQADSKGKAWTFMDFKILYDHSDSMKDEYFNSLLALEPFLDFQVCDLLQFLKIELVFFKDYDSDIVRHDPMWWDSDVHKTLSKTVTESEFDGGGNFAENPLGTIMKLWNDNSAWTGGHQRTFLLFTDAPMHQPNDGDKTDHDNTEYTVQDVCNALQDPKSPYKGTIHVVSPATIGDTDAGTAAYWDNRTSDWSNDDYAGHANAADLAACTGGAWYDISDGLFYGNLKSSQHSMKVGPGQNHTVSFTSSNLETNHEVVVRVTLDDGQQGEIRFENIEYPKLETPKSATPSGCDQKSCMDILAVGDSDGDGVYWIDPDGEGEKGNGNNLDRFQVYCDMTTQGGGFMVAQLNDDDNVIIAHNSDSNPWYKCDDDSATHFDWTTEEELASRDDYSGKQENVVQLSYINPATEQEFEKKQLDAIRDMITELAQTTRMVVTVADNDNKDLQNRGNSGHEAYIRGAQGGGWKLITPGSNGNCGGTKNWPQPETESGFYLWHSSDDFCEVDGDVGEYSGSSMTALEQNQLLPESVKLEIRTGGGIAFGYESQDILVR